MTGVPVPESLLQALRKGQRFLLTGHRRPDGDSLGSALGLARILRQLGKGALVWNRDEMPPIYSALAGSSRIHVGEILDAVRSAGLAIADLSTEETDLEDIFLQLTRDEDSHAA